MYIYIYIYYIYIYIYINIYMYMYIFRRTIAICSLWTICPYFFQKSWRQKKDHKKTPYRFLYWYLKLAWGNLGFTEKNSIFRMNGRVQQVILQDLVGNPVQLWGCQLRTLAGQNEWCESASIVCGSGSTKFGQCGSGSRTKKSLNLFWTIF